MHDIRRLASLAVPLLVLGSSIAMAADGTPAAEPAAPEAPAAQPAAQPAPAEPAAPQPQEGEAGLGAGDLFMPDPVEVAGCTAEIYCINTPPDMISCSSATPGTCQSWYGNCGTVSCNGQVTKCPGSCTSGVHCYSLCGFLQGECEFGCCKCPP
jgi:hypothetical protein